MFKICLKYMKDWKDLVYEKLLKDEEMKTQRDVLSKRIKDLAIELVNANDKIMRLKILNELDIIKSTLLNLD